MLTTLKKLIREQPAVRSSVMFVGAMARTMATAPPGVYTLCYHRVARRAASQFATQIRFLKQYGDFIAPDTAVDLLQSGRASDRVSFVLSLDDGYADNVDVALPVLVGMAVPAILFMVSDWIAEPPGRFERSQGYMDRADLERWCAAGMQVGSHSASHRRFSQLSDDDAIAELTRSRDALCAMTGRAIQHFACPWGVANADYRIGRDPDLARAAGYRTFFTTRRGRATQAGALLSMPRHVIEPDWGLHHLKTLLGGSRFAEH